MAKHDFSGWDRPKIQERIKALNKTIANFSTMLGSPGMPEGLKDSARTQLEAAQEELRQAWAALGKLKK